MSANTYRHRLPGEFEYRGVLYGEHWKGLDIHIAERYKHDPVDVLVASYPKTGLKAQNTHYTLDA